MNQTIKKLKWLLSSLLVVLSLQIQAAAAPDFTLKSKAGNNIKLSELKGSIVMVNFWASWCGPCRKELPAFEKLYRKYEPLGLIILAVNVDDDPAKANGLLSEVNISFPVLYDTDQSVSELYEVEAMPSTYFINRDGELVESHRSFKEGDEKKYKAIIKKLIRQ
jgi:peroxiredoxin